MIKRGIYWKFLMLFSFIIIFAISIISVYSQTCSPENDLDRDGICNEPDRCPNTPQSGALVDTRVDSNGCSCTQKTTNCGSNPWCCTTPNTGCGVLASGAVSCMNVLVGAVAPAGGIGSTGPTSGTTCEPRVDVFAFKTVAASIPCPTDGSPCPIGGLPRVVALSNVPGSIEILVDGVSRPCTTSTSTFCEVTTPASSGGVQYLSGGGTATYQATLRSPSGDHGIIARSDLKRVTIARQNLAYQNFCVDETRWSTDGDVNSIGVPCSQPFPSCSRPGKQIIPNVICASTGVNTIGCRQIEVDCATCTGAGTGTLCYTNALSTPSASEGGALRLSIPLCTAPTTSSAPGAPTAHPTIPTIPPARQAASSESEELRNRLNPLRPWISVNGVRSVSDPSLTAPNVQGRYLANPVPVSVSASSSQNIRFEVGVDGNAPTGQTMTDLPIRVYFTRRSNNAWPAVSGVYGVGIGRIPADRGVIYYDVPASVLQPDDYAVFVVVGDSTTSLLSSSYLLFFQVQGGTGAAPPVGGATPAGPCPNRVIPLTGSPPSPPPRVLEPQLGSATNPGPTNSYYNGWRLGPKPFIHLTSNGNPNNPHESRNADSNDIDHPANTVNNPLLIDKSDPVDLVIAAYNIFPQNDLPMRIYINKAIEDSSNPPNILRWEPQMDSWGYPVGVTATCGETIFHFSDVQTQQWPVGLYSVYFVIGDSAPNLYATGELFYRVRERAGAQPSPTIPPACPQGTSISAELT